jgi:hypothetical protein
LAVESQSCGFVSGEPGVDANCCNLVPPNFGGDFSSSGCLCLNLGAGAFSDFVGAQSDLFVSRSFGLVVPNDLFEAKREFVEAFCSDVEAFLDFFHAPTIYLTGVWIKWLILVKNGAGAELLSQAL